MLAIFSLKTIWGNTQLIFLLYMFTRVDNHRVIERGKGVDCRCNVNIPRAGLDLLSATRVDKFEVGYAKGKRVAPILNEHHGCDM